MEIRGCNEKRFDFLQEGWVLLPVHCENTRQTESPEPRSRRPSCWPWRESSARSSTFPSPSAQSSRVPSTWQRPRLKSGFRTGEPKPSDCRRQNLRNWKWQRSLCCLQLSGFPFLSVRTSLPRTRGRTRSRGTRCRSPPWDCTPLTSDTACTTSPERHGGTLAVGHRGWDYFLKATIVLWLPHLVRGGQNLQTDPLLRTLKFIHFSWPRQ